MSAIRHGGSLFSLWLTGRWNYPVLSQNTNAIIRVIFNSYIVNIIKSMFSVPALHTSSPRIPSQLSSPALSARRLLFSCHFFIWSSYSIRFYSHSFVKLTSSVVYLTSLSPTVPYNPVCSMWRRRPANSNWQSPIELNFVDLKRSKFSNGSVRPSVLVNLHLQIVSGLFSFNCVWQH